MGVRGNMGIVMLHLVFGLTIVMVREVLDGRLGEDIEGST
jgi:hypothetical protein